MHWFLRGEEAMQPEEVTKHEGMTKLGEKTKPEEARTHKKHPNLKRVTEPWDLEEATLSTSLWVFTDTNRQATVELRGVPLPENVMMIVLNRWIWKYPAVRKGRAI